MDMYQKRKMRKEGKNNSNNNGVAQIVINWVNPILVNSDTNPLFIRKSRIFLFTY